jgi:hypothetical protein
LAGKQEEVTKAKEARRLKVVDKKRRLAQEKLQKAVKKKLQDKEKARRARESVYWKEIMAQRWRDQLQATMKYGTPLAFGSYTGVYCGFVPAWCISNQRRRKLLMEQKQALSIARPRQSDLVGPAAARA